MYIFAVYNFNIHFMRKISTLLASLALGCAAMSQSVNKYIIVDQFGYLPDADKVAVLVDPQVGINASDNYTPGKTFEVVNVATGKPVFKGSPVVWKNGKIDAQAGDKGWWFDFSTVKDTGSFYVLDKENNQKSFNFRIANNVYLDVLNAVCKMFYYNRCNSAKVEPYADKRWTDGVDFMDKNQDSECHDISDRTNPAKVKDLSGGWWDAGDYNKYIAFLYRTLPHMFAAYKQNPEVFTDKLNIPESGNGVPDIIDEIVVELKWMRKMQEADGGVHIKMGVINWDSKSPASEFKGERFYGPVCSSSAIVLSESFAQASLVLKQFPVYKELADDLLKRSVLSWKWYLANPKCDTCDNQVIKMGDADVSIPEQEKIASVAAVYLFEATGDETYNTFLKENLEKQKPYIPDNSDAYLTAYHTALIDYTTNPKADATLKKLIIDGQKRDIEKVTWFYGWQDTLSLYRSYTSDPSFHWGSIMPMCGTGIVNHIAVQNGLSGKNTSDFKKKALGIVHFVNGINPFNTVYISNMYELGGDNCVNRIYHECYTRNSKWGDTKTAIGPPPGYLTGGPNKQFKRDDCCNGWCNNQELCKVDVSCAMNQPVLKTYIDENYAWPVNTWQFSEPAIYYQAYYIRLLAPFVRVK